jgi:plasmid maintenance system antidote protein VapI
MAVETRPATAVLFGRQTNTDPMPWLRLQAEYDLWQVLHN